MIDKRRKVEYCPFCGSDDLKDMYDDNWFCRTCQEEFHTL